MPLLLEGSCRCGGVKFSIESHTPYPYQLCYCSICRKTAGGGGYAINLMGSAASLQVAGRENIGLYRAEVLRNDESGEGRCQTSSAERNFCTKCASALWLFDPTWPDLVHPFASVVDTELPHPPARVHLMLRYKASWIDPDIGADDAVFEEYPEQSIEDWHKSRGLWID